MLKTIAILFCITLIPGLELRASIPMGILGGKWIASPMAWPAVVLTCVISNILIGWAVFWLLGPVVKFFRRIGFIDRLLAKYLDSAQRRLKPNVEKYGFWGLAVFIGIPLPLTGAYSGAAGAYALGMETKRFMIANVVGVLIAAVCVTVICLLIRAGIDCAFFNLLIKS
ncbi:MAG: small multi-drug export protein [Victivallales bacterium]|nr:small multi-drug export protein [Victivallales bacterium]